MPDHRALAACARRQDGIVTTADVSGCDFSRSQLRAMVDSGQLTRIHRNVYAVTAVEPGPRGALRAAVLSSGGAASHRSAGWLHGLLDWPGRQPEISLPAHRRFTSPDVTVHRQRDWTDGHLVAVDGILATDLLRTVCDLGTKVSTVRLRTIIERAVHQGAVTVDDIVRRRSELARRGRDGVGPVRLLLDEWAPDLVATDSPLEERLVEIIRGAGMPEPVRQHEVFCDGERFLLDLAYPTQHIAIEGDGFGVHGARSSFERDRARQNLLVLHGWRVLRFTWTQVTAHPESVLSALRRALRG